MFLLHDVSDPSPSLLHDDDGIYTALVSSGEKFMIGDGLRPKYEQHPFEVHGVETGQHDEITFCHPPSLCTVHEGENYIYLTVLVWF